MKTLLLLLCLSTVAKAAPLVTSQDFGAVSNSSVSVNLQGRTNNGQLTYLVATDTLTITVNGLNLVEACYSGNLTPNGAGNHVGWNFLVDSTFILGLSKTQGALSGFMSSGSESQNASGCFPIPPGTLTGGSHKFGFISMCNSVCTYGGSATTSTAYFWVKEVH